MAATRGIEPLTSLAFVNAMLTLSTELRGHKKKPRLELGGRVLDGAERNNADWKLVPTLKWYVLTNDSKEIKSAKMRKYSETESVKKFYEKTRRSGSCVIWVGCINKSGYGRVRRSGFTYDAHRFSWIINNGPIPKGLFVCHKCDNPPCVNIDHLFLGTNKDNMIDCASKGRLYVQKFSKIRTHCKSGKHVWSEENKIKRPKEKGDECRLCALDASKRRIKMEQI